jgi:hypothetical protein
MKIYSDFSDTVAKPKTGDKFPPFELELGKMIEQEIDTALKDKFVSKYSDGYKNFQAIRRDNSIPYEKRALTWLQPFTNLLNVRHIKKLVSEFELNKNFVDFTKNLTGALYTKKLEITIVSGTLTQIIKEFLNRESVKNNLNYINFNILATDLIMNSEGYFTGKIKNTNELVYKGNFPDKCLIIGDNAMENYGLGARLINVQNYECKNAGARFKKMIIKYSR